MQFIYPYFLWAFAILAIPIIIHLFYFRRFKKVYFSNVKFLQSIKEETAARSKLRNLLVLLSRLLAFSCLILAFALPFLHQKKAQIGQKASSVFIDNSFSMEAKTEDVILLEKAKAFAREVVKSHNDGDLIQILTHDFEGRHQRLVDKAEALNLIDEIAIGPAVRSLSTVLSRQYQLLNGENVAHRNIYWLSDFQKSITDVEKFEDTTYAYYLLPLQSVEESNLSIDTAWFESPVARINESNSIFIKVSNRGNGPAENVRLSALHGGEEKPISVIDLEAGETMTDTFNLSVTQAGWQHVQIKLTDHPVTFDDNYYLAFEAKDQMSVLILNEQGSPPYLNSIFQSIESFKPMFQSIKNVDYSAFGDADLIVLNEISKLSSGLRSEMINYMKAGGNVLLFPSVSANIKDYNDFFTSARANRIKSVSDQSRQVSSINTDEFIFKDVFTQVSQNIRLPSSSQSLVFDRSGRNEEFLLRFRDGGNYLSKYQLEDGRLFVCASPLTPKYNSLSGDGEIFIPMIYKMAMSQSARQKMAYTIGKDEVIELAGNYQMEDGRLEMVGKETFIPGTSTIGQKTLLTLNNQVESNGIIELMSNGQLIKKVAFNYDRQESELSYFSQRDIEVRYGDQINMVTADRTTNLASMLKESQEGRPLWKWLLIFTLIFLAVEQLLLKFWKV